MKWHVKEITYDEKEGDRNKGCKAYLCTDCLPAVSDIWKITRRRRYDTRCNRCGQSLGTREQAEILSRK